MSRITADDIAGLSPEDRLMLIGDLWDSLNDADVPLSASQSAELARRIDAFDADRSSVVTWDDLKAELGQRSP